MSGAHQWSKGRCVHCGAWEHDMNLSAVCDTSERDRAVAQLQQPMQHLAALAQPQPSPSAGEVLADDAMADALSVAMKAKLARAREKGRGGWEDTSEISVSDLWRMMVEHAHKPNLDMVDVANFAGMIWWRLDHNPGEREELLRALVAAQQPTPEREALAAKHLSLAHTRLSTRAYAAAQLGKSEMAKFYRAAAHVVADELGMYRAAVAAEARGEP